MPALLTNRPTGERLKHKIQDLEQQLREIRAKDQPQHSVTSLHADVACPESISPKALINSIPMGWERDTGHLCTPATPHQVLCPCVSIHAAVHSPALVPNVVCASCSQPQTDRSKATALCAQLNTAPATDIDFNINTAVWSTEGTPRGIAIHGVYQDFDNNSIMQDYTQAGLCNEWSFLYTPT